MLNKMVDLLSWLAGFSSVYFGMQDGFKNESTILLIIAIIGMSYSYKVSKDSK